MRFAKVTLSILAFAVLAFTVVHAPPAGAVPIPVATSALQSDGGAPTPVTVSMQSTYTAQCTNPSCLKVFRYDGGTETVSCSTDYNLPSSPDAYTFQTAGFNRLQFVAADAGQPGCRVFLEGKNIR